MTELHGLVLAGGSSSRMRRDKALLDYHGKPQVQWLYDLMLPLCRHVWVSVRAGHRDAVREALPTLTDVAGFDGPAAGIVTAHRHDPGAAWLVVACDLPFVNRELLDELVARRDRTQAATAFRSTHDGLPEPLCAIWEPAGCVTLMRRATQGRQCPRKTLIETDVTLLALPQADALDNVNTPEQWRAANAALAQRPAPAD